MHLAELCSASRVVYDRSVSTVVKPNNLISYRNIYHNTRKRFYVYVPQCVSSLPRLQT